jgi:SHS2 domain-containing protein
MGIEAWGVSCREVLITMARALTILMYGDSRAEEVVNTEVALSGEDAEELMVGWLNEIVYWCDKDNLVPASFTIRGIDARKLQGTIAGETFDPQRHLVEHQVKSVTYHQACLEERSEGWYARVYVDL